MYHSKTDAYHFRHGDYQGKKTGRWDCELHGSDPHQARRSASLSREPDLRPKTGRTGVFEGDLTFDVHEGLILSVDSYVRKAAQHFPCVQNSGRPESSDGCATRE